MRDFPWLETLSRRERQVMSVLVAAGQATAAEVRDRLVDSASYSAVRAVLRALEEKGLIRHTLDGPRYVYEPAMAPQRARKSLLRQVLDTVFLGSREQMMAALLDEADARATPEELDRLARLIAEARRKRR